MNDLIAGRIDAYFPGPALAKSHIESGRIIPIATSGQVRSELFPDLPAIGEVYPGFSATNWYAFVAPAGTPPEVVEWWNERIVAVLQDPVIKDKLVQLGLDVMPSTAEVLAQLIERESNIWSEVIKDRGIGKE